MDQRQIDLKAGQQRLEAEDSDQAHKEQLEGSRAENKSAGPEYDRLKIDIEESEVRLAETLQAVQAKLSLEDAVRQAGERIQQAAAGKIEEVGARFKKMGENIGKNATEAIGEDPIPAVLLGLGIGWMILQGFTGEADEKSADLRDDRSERDKKYPPGIEEPCASDYSEGCFNEFHGEVRATAEEARNPSDRAQEQSSHVASAVNNKAGGYGEPTQHGVRSAGGGISRLARERPLAAGFAGLAVGALAGLAVARAFGERGILSEALQSFGGKALELFDAAWKTAKSVEGEVNRATEEETGRQHTVTH